MAQNYRVHEMSSQEFRTLAEHPWAGRGWGAAKVTYEPALCTYLLRQKCHNRAISPTELERLKHALLDHRWFETGETIILTSHFEALDGQHRLTAGEVTEVPFTSFTVWGVDPDAFAGIDIGKKRSAADQLAAMQIPDYSAMAAALRVHYRLDQGAMRAPDVILPDHEIVPYLQAHQKIRYSLGYGQRAHRFLMPSLGTALHYRFHGRDEGVADQFFEDLILGENLTRRDPVWVLRELLGIRRPEGQRRARQASDTKTKADIAAQVIETWNAVRHKKMVALQGLRTIDQRPFPEIA